jgi:hypothetical protein
MHAAARDKVVFGNDRQACEVYMDAMLELDALAKSITCKFSEVLRRYDCSQPYSVNFDCTRCKVGAQRTYFLTGASILRHHKSSSSKYYRRMFVPSVLK